MNPLRSNDGTSAVFEVLEPRLLLSAALIPDLDAPGFGVPAYVDVDFPDHKPDTDIVSACLREAHADLEAGGEGAINLVGSLQRAGVRVNDAGELQVYVHVNAVDASTICALEGAGLQVETSNARMKVVQGWLPHTNLDVAAKVEGVVGITPPEYGITNSGSVTTEGDADLNADDLRALFGGITGDGIKIGVISDGVDNWGDVAGDPYYDLGNSGDTILIWAIWGPPTRPCRIPNPDSRPSAALCRFGSFLVPRLPAFGGPLVPSCLRAFVPPCRSYSSEFRAPHS